ncbi:aminoglycoside phosphotransferase [Lentzea sp. CA-135723]|uniref:aminoglycoside phosphotransferase n=1 Tax=Lentzea sp. CA-135723 TaxID=3239950 RepID=UPI003D8F8639
MTATEVAGAVPSREEMDGTLRTVAVRFGLTITGRPIYGWRYRSAGAVATTRDGTRRWLRVGTERERDLGPFWTGTLDANTITGIAKPEVLATDEWALPHAGRRVRADVTTWMPGTPCSAAEVLRTPLHLPDQWWSELTSTVTTIRATSTSRYNDGRPREGRVRTVFGDQAADAVRAVTDRATQHGDLHWANLQHGPFALLDWEMWGSHAAGGDEAMLYLRSLLVPATADRLRSLFADILDSPAGRAAQIRAAAALLHRADEHPDLVEPLRQHVRPLLEKLGTKSVW